MLVLFKYPRMIEGKLYSKGAHKLPDSLASHWFVQALVKAGDIAIEEPQQEFKLEAPQAPIEELPVEAQMEAPAPQAVQPSKKTSLLSKKGGR